MIQTILSKTRIHLEWNCATGSPAFGFVWKLDLCSFWNKYT